MAIAPVDEDIRSVALPFAAKPKNLNGELVGDVGKPIVSPFSLHMVPNNLHGLKTLQASTLLNSQTVVMLPNSGKGFMHSTVAAFEKNSSFDFNNNIS